jgi:hypothetical protein
MAMQIRRGRALLFSALLIAVAGFLPGCQREYRKSSNAWVGYCENGDYHSAAAKACKQELDHDEGDRNRVIYLIEAGRCLQMSGAVQESERCFDDAYEALRPYLDTKAEASASSGVAETLINQTMEKYKGTPSDRMMICALNAFNCLALNDMDSARLELNRAVEWQEDAKHRFASEVEAKNRKNVEAAKKKKIEVEEKTVTKHQSLAPHFANIEDMQGYADYANPFVNHLRGVFCLAHDEREQARFEFRQVAGMTPEAQAMLEPDILLCESTGERVQPTTWVYFFTGFAPRLEELRLDIPIPVGGVNYVSAAFPIMKFNDDFAQTLVVRGGGHAGESTPIADMDRIVGSEFRTRLPLIIMQEFLSSAVKAAATYAASETGSDWSKFIAKIGGIAYQAASTAADLRTWRTMPKRIAVGRIPTPADGRLEFEAGRLIGSCEVIPGACNVVLVTLPKSSTPYASILNAPLTAQATPAPMLIQEASTQ